MAPENVNAVIAASAALSGVLISLIGNWLLSSIKQQHDHAALLRSKYEELAFLVVDSVGDYQKILVAESNHQLLRNSQPVSAQKVVALAQLYFPELKDAANSYLSAIVHFRNACAVVGTGKKGADWAESLVASPKVVDAQLALEKSKHILESQIQAFAKTYTLS